MLQLVRFSQCVGRVPLSARVFRSFATAPTALTNDQIRAPTMRVIFPDATGKNTWKIMDRNEALDFAKKLKLDLVLGKLIYGVRILLLLKFMLYHLYVIISIFTPLRMCYIYYLL